MYWSRGIKFQFVRLRDDQQDWEINDMFLMQKIKKNIIILVGGFSDYIVPLSKT